MLPLQGCGFDPRSGDNKGSPGGSVVKNPPAMQETQVQSVGGEDPEEDGNSLQHSYLQNSMDSRPGGLTGHGVVVRHD